MVTHVVRLKFAKSSGIRPIKSIRSQLPSVRSFATTTTTMPTLLPPLPLPRPTHVLNLNHYNNRRRRVLQLYSYDDGAMPNVKPDGIDDHLTLFSKPTWVFQVGVGWLLSRTYKYYIPNNIIIFSCRK